ncbi:hypothetical protein PRIPAC_96403 [Pristionchus pacificus]|uniref:Uncharacterized protein n=1 Tax=Pristionchus pacificus TaxID=54126 RepID=A0A2A6D186_PRIPA|nr:hypothetical protein PRIPAC_96403 [Pristionchus pacificus]|eukprot:PDM84252.1 hypothetical protein PRIPAC_33275 [Pristionchus pacificus]
MSMADAATAMTATSRQRRKRRCMMERRGGKCVYGKTGVTCKVISSCTKVTNDGKTARGRPTLCLVTETVVLILRGIQHPGLSIDPVCGYAAPNGVTAALQLFSELSSKGMGESASLPPKKNRWEKMAESTRKERGSVVGSEMHPGQRTPFLSSSSF